MLAKHMLSLGRGQAQRIEERLSIEAHRPTAVSRLCSVPVCPSNHMAKAPPKA